MQFKKQRRKGVSGQSRLTGIVILNLARDRGINIGDTYFFYLQTYRICVTDAGSRTGIGN